MATSATSSLSTRRIAAMVRRSLLSQHRSPDFWFLLLVLPMVDGLLFGSIGVAYGVGDGPVVLLVTGILLFHLVWQLTLAGSFGMLDEVWSRNLMNLIATPLTERELLSSFALVGLMRTGVAVTVIGGVGLVFFAVSPTAAGLVLVFPQDDLLRLVGEIGDRLDVVMVPKVEGPWDIHYVDRLLAQLEGKHGIRRPILVHAILETASSRGDEAHALVALARLNFREQEGDLGQRLLPAGEHLVHVALVPGVEDDRVTRGIEDPVHGNGELDHSEVRPEMPTGSADIADQEGPNFASERRELIGGQFPQISGARDRLQQGHPTSLRRALTTC